jgi:hypothetical protein
MMLSTATQVGSTLLITASAGTAASVRPIVMEVDAIDHTKIDVIDAGTLLGKFPMSSIHRVNVTVAGDDAIKVDDSNGLPFALATLISLSGGGGNNSLDLVGSQALQLNGNEVFFAGTSGGGALGLGTDVGSVVFSFSSAIGSVTDDLATPQLIVQAPGQAVSLVGGNGTSETLKGLAGTGGAGNTLEFRGKSSVRLELDSPSATATLNATAAAIGLGSFEVDVFGQQDRVIVNATPSNVRTIVSVAGGQDDSVNLRGNAGPVNINGNATTVVALGTDTTNTSLSVTSGIKGDVTVVAAEALQILDGGNVTSQEQMTVTESTVSGTGMFGNNAVVIQYEDTFLLFETGQLANTYTVKPSHPGATFFAGGISINDDFSSAGFSVIVNVDSGSGLGLSLFNHNPANGFLFVVAPGATFNPFAMTTPDGSEDVTFLVGLASQVIYEGFDTVGHS